MFNKLVCMLLMTIFLAGCAIFHNTERDINLGGKVEDSTNYQSNGYVIRVVDGDTIIVDIEGKEERVRLIGVDTPETKHPSKPVQYFGKEASAFTKRLVEDKKVMLGYDCQLRDRYDRLLAYVYLEDGSFLNAEIIKQGYGFAYLKFNFKYLEEFRQYEKEARVNKRGLWGK